MPRFWTFIADVKSMAGLVIKAAKSLIDGCTSQIHVELFEIPKFINVGKFKISTRSNLMVDSVIIGNDTIMEEYISGPK